MIMFLNPSPILNAREFDNRTLVEQVNRACEALATCHRILDGIPGKLRRTHTKFGYYDYQFVLPGEHEDYPRVPLMYENPKEPFCQWLISGTSAYEWLISFYYACGREYSYRHSGTHYGMRCLKYFQEYPKNVIVDDVTPVDIDVDFARQQYMSARFSRLFDWGRRGPPSWWKKC